MEGQRQRSSRTRRRRRKARAEAHTTAEPITIVARRPNSPLLGKNGNGKPIAASAAPTPKVVEPPPPSLPKPEARRHDAPRRGRIVQLRSSDSDEREQRRRRLLDRVMTSEGRGAISRAVDAYLDEGFQLPVDQEVQLQLLEHFDEARSREAIGTLSQLLAEEPPIKRPVFEQRLRRLEEYADEADTREAAAALRRVIRS